MGVPIFGHEIFIDWGICKVTNLDGIWHSYVNIPPVFFSSTFFLFRFWWTNGSKLKKPSGLIFDFWFFFANLWSLYHVTSKKTKHLILRLVLVYPIATFWEICKQNVRTTGVFGPKLRKFQILNLRWTVLTDALLCPLSKYVNQNARKRPHGA